MPNVSLPTPITLLVLTALALLSSCDQVKKLAGNITKKPAPKTAEPYTGPLVSEIGEGSYDTFPQQRGRVVVIGFHATWSGPCRQLDPQLETIANQQQGMVLVGKVDVDKNKKIAVAEGIKDLPDVRIYRDGALMDRFVGLPSDEEVRRRIEAQLKGLTQIAAVKPSGPITIPMTKDWMPEGVRRR